MQYRTQLGRADLLACLQVYGEGQLEAFAAALGYTRRPPDQMAQPSAAPERRVVRSGPETARVRALGPAPRARFYRVVAQRQLEPAERVLDTPAWLQEAQPLREEIHAAEGLYPPPQPPLMPWSRLWPFLRTALGAQVATSRLDLRRIVERLARGQILRHLPRQSRQGWATACQLLVDYAAPLLPFRTDFHTAHERLAQLHGEYGLKRFALLDGDPEGRWAVRTPQDWEEIDYYPLPAAGTPVLVLSDLGCIDKTDLRRRQWRRLGARLRRVGCRPVVLMPCPSRWWDPELTHLFTPVCWDRTVWLPRRPGTRQAWSGAGASAERDVDAERLLSLLGAAIRVEPALLRAVRYLLPAHEADVGSEAAAWNHARVHATPLAFYYDHAAIPHYRRAFAHQDPSLRQQVAELITAHHAHLSPSIGYEEQWLLAEGAGLPAADQVQRFLEMLVKTLHVQDGAFVESAHAWVHRMTRRQHPPVWHNEALAAAWATVHLPQLQAGEPVPPLTGWIWRA